MFSNLILAAFVVAGGAGLFAMAQRDHRTAAAWRAHLLDKLAPTIDRASIALRPDGFPALAGYMPDGRQLMIELIPDSLVFRRLPQLWLIFTLVENRQDTKFSIGALARPTGAEFYSWVIELPQQIETPQHPGSPLLMRHDGVLAQRQADRLGPALARLFRDPGLKEIVATPRVTRVVRQISEGERGAHLLTRQMRFPVAEVDPKLVERCIADVEELRLSLTRQGETVEELADGSIA